jgi:hypothetical protein
MRPKQITVSAAEASSWIPLSWHQYSLVTNVSGTLTYSVEYTADNVQDPDATLNPVNVAGFINITDDRDGNIAFPVRAVRLNVSAYTSGSVTLTIIENRGNA